MIYKYISIVSLMLFLVGCVYEDTIIECSSNPSYPQGKIADYIVYSSSDSEFMSRYYVEFTSPLTLLVSSNLERADNRTLDSFDSCQSYSGNSDAWEDQVILGTELRAIITSLFEGEMYVLASASVSSADCFDDAIYVGGLMFPVSRCEGSFIHDDKRYTWAYNTAKSGFEFANGLVEFILLEDDRVTHFILLNDFSAL